ncbi:uncharacterized protein LOC117791242 isoform X2 [Drosophila innubila]|nr:uncharacterized protein LOC117791242 isoform X2 [Drosophila innubila]
MSLTIPFGGYTPGQRINYELYIDNQALGNDLKCVKLSLIQIYEFRAYSGTYKSKICKNDVSSELHSQMVRRLSKRLINGSLNIPTTLPPTSTKNYIIKISYVIYLFINAGDFQRDWEMEIPIIIGTIPLEQIANDPAHTTPWIPQTPDTPAVPAADLPPSYDVYRPPTFEEATHIGEVFEDTDDNNGYNNFVHSTGPRYEDSADVPLLRLPPTPTAYRASSIAAD